jgi:hypothetical protein
VRRWETSRRITASADAVWDVLVDLDRWPAWGPSVRSAELHGGGRRLHEGARGTVTTAVGLDLRFVVTEWSEGRRWTWEVGGLPATSHAVHAVADDRCVASFGVPRLAGPYLAVCRVALARIAGLAEAPP